jgi:transposase
VCDRFGRALGFELIAGNRSELRAARRLLAVAVVAGMVGRVVCARAYSSKAWREAITAAGGTPVVPAPSSHPSVEYDRAAYRRRHHVEQAWGRLKEWRAVATRYAKTAASFLGVLHVAAALDWIKHGIA